ncbi:hypothetical protein Syun_026016 [Stephania yunnanensis]|uniref:Uncharacterized protein n=1 Tax=Stephania yunnanensis TaxID=152371 RepID=A0AAP0HWA9_9MAGN
MVLEILPPPILICVVVVQCKCLTNEEEDLKQFRKWGSRTPGHPENFETFGVEWRYANAKAEATMNVQSHTVERSFYALLVKKKSEMHDSLQRKRIELGYLKKLEMLSSIMGAQMPYLDEWSTLECEYSSSLSGAIKALQDASVQLPIMNLLVSIRNEPGFPIEISENWVVLPSCLFPDMLVLLLLKESLMFLRFLLSVLLKESLLFKIQYLFDFLSF